MKEFLIDDRRDRLPRFTSVCGSCRWFDHLRDDARRCRAFPLGIPEPIWLGDHDHLTAFDGDHGVRFEPMTDADQTATRRRVEALFTLRERARARDYATRLGVIPAALIDALPGNIETELTITTEHPLEVTEAPRVGDVTQWWLASADPPTYGRARIKGIDRTRRGPGVTACIVLEPGIREFWATLSVGANIELCDGPVTLGNATITALASLDIADLARPGIPLTVSTDDAEWGDLETIEATCSRPAGSGDQPLAWQTGAIAGWRVPWIDQDSDEIVAYARMDLIESDLDALGRCERVRLRPLVPYLWQYVRIGARLRRSSDDDPVGEATVSSIGHAQVLAGRH